MIDRDRFFAAARARPFGGSMTGLQVAGCNAILDGWESHPEFTDQRWLAYMLATAKHETAHTMQPIHEYGGDSYFFRMYDKDGDRPAVAAELGNTEPGDGARFHGRGYVQLTGRRNYRTMGALLGVALVATPDLALDPMIAAEILFEGMTRSDSSFGDFTGKCLEMYFNDTTDDPIEARRVINGLDRANDIAALHRDFLAALGQQAKPVRRLLFIGVEGDDVRELERALGRRETGQFNWEVDVAVRDFQERRGLLRDGIVGKDTRAALGIA
jgi:putative chitinase